MAKKAYIWDGTNWTDIISGSIDLTNYLDSTQNQISGNRNLIINGDFRIDQRNAGGAQTITANAALAYTVDRWYSYATSGSASTLTGQRIAGSGSDQYYYRISSATTANTGWGFGQRIEDVNSIHLAGKSATLSVSLAATNLTSITWTAYYATTTNTFGTVASPTRTQIATGTFTVNSSLSRKNATFTVPSGATTGIEILFTGGQITSGNTVTFSNVQLEANTFATLFEKRLYATELANCQRYYYRSGGGLYTKHGNGIVNAATTSYVITPLPVPLRTLPTTAGVTAGGTTNVIASGCSIYDGTTSPAITTLAIDNASLTLPSFLATCSAGGITAGRPSFIQSQNSITAFFSIDVEL